MARRRKISWTRRLLAALLALLVGALSYDALRVPQVAVPTMRDDQPFRAHFRLTNPSLLFTMAGLRLVCVTNEATLDKALHLQDITSAQSPAIDFDPGRSLSYSCPFDRVVAGLGAPQALTVSLRGSFAILGLHRSFESAQYHWAAGDPGWKEWIAAR